MKKGDRVRLSGNFPKYPDGVFGTIIRKGHKDHWVVKLDVDMPNTEYHEARLIVVNGETKPSVPLSKELIDSIEVYNNHLQSIAQKILGLKINYDSGDIEVKNLYGLKDKLSVINSSKSRQYTEQLLEDVILEYGYMLETLTLQETASYKK